MLDHPGAIQVPTGTPKWPKTAPKMALHDQKWPFMTANGPKTLLMSIIYDIMSCWGLFRGPLKGAQTFSYFNLINWGMYV